MNPWTRLNADFNELKEAEDRVIGERVPVTQFSPR